MKDFEVSPGAWDRAVTFLVFAGLVFVFSRTVADPDLWGHVLYGLAHLQEGELARVDPYAYTAAGHEWINHEVLSELTFGLLFSAFGALGLIVFKTALAVVLFGLLHRHLVRAGLDPLRAGLVVALASFAVLPGSVTVRPQMFTHLFFALLLFALWAAEERGARWLWCVPVILAVWINFHGGVLAGLGVVLVWSGATVGLQLARRWLGPSAGPRVRVPAAVGTAVAALAALLLNPYGWRLPEFLVRTATVPRPEIHDWQPLAIGSLQGLAYALLLAVAAAALAGSRRPRSGPLMSVLAVTAVMPLIAVRHLELFALAVVVLAGDHIANAWMAWRASRARERPPSPARVRAAFVGVAFLASATFAASSVPNFRCLRIDPDIAMGFPARAMAFLEDSGASGRLAVPFGWGQYSIWHLHPEIQVSMDGRRETVYPEGVYRVYLDFHQGVGRWDAHLEEPPADLALLQTGSAPYNLVSLRPDWRPVHRDGTATIFVREGSSAVASVANGGGARRDLDLIPTDGSGLCFP